MPLDLSHSNTYLQVVVLLLSIAIPLVVVWWLVRNRLVLGQGGDMLRTGTGRLLAHFRQGLGASAVVCGRGLTTLQREVTHDGRVPLARAIAIVLLLLPVFAGLLVADNFLLTLFFDARFPEPIAMPWGKVVAGQVLALLPISFSLLVGYLFDGMLNMVPLPHGRDLADTVQRRVRQGLALLAGGLLVGLLVFVYDLGNEVYDDRGRNHCTVAAAAAVPAAPSRAPFDPFAPPAAGSAASAPSPTSLTASPVYTSCLAAWQADAMSRSLQVAPGLIVLVLIGLFAWVPVQAIALAGLAGLGLLMLAAIGGGFAVDGVLVVLGPGAAGSDNDRSALPPGRSDPR